MKLISESLDSNIQLISEGTGADKKLYISGIFMQAEQKNRNGRIYPKKVLFPAVHKYVTEQVSKGRAVGELNHPDGPTVNLDKVSHRITELTWNGDDVIGKALILNTPSGQIVKGLLEGGVYVGVSTRGMGSLERIGDAMYVKNDFILATVDIVQDPSAPDAFVNGIMEGVEYFVKGNEIVVEKIQKKIHKMSSNQLAEAQVQLFKDFLKEISSK